MSRRRAGVFGFVVACVAPLAVGGCGEHKKVTECNALVGVVNAGIEKVQKVTTGAADAGTVAGDLRAVADTLDETAAAVGNVSLSIGDLQGFANDYASVAKAVAGAARAVAAAGEKADEAAMQTAQVELDAAVRREDPLVEAINGFCRNP